MYAERDFFFRGENRLWRFSVRIFLHLPCLVCGPGGRDVPCGALEHWTVNTLRLDFEAKVLGQRDDHRAMSVSGWQVGLGCV